MTDWWTQEQEEAHRRLLARARRLSVEEIFQIAVRAGVYTPDGELTEPYRDDSPASSPEQTD